MLRNSSTHSIVSKISSQSRSASSQGSHDLGRIYTTNSSSSSRSDRSASNDFHSDGEPHGSDKIYLSNLDFDEDDMPPNQVAKRSNASVIKIEMQPKQPVRNQTSGQTESKSK